MLIPLDRIKAADHPVRRSRSEGGIEELASSMVKSGQVCPVKVRQVRDHYEVIYGHRRVEAARRADLGCVDAIVEDCDDAQALLNAIIENLQREDMSAVDVADALARLKQESGWTAAEVARALGWSEGRVKHLLAIAHAAEPVRTAMEGDAGVPLSERHFNRTGPLAGDPETRAAVLRKASAENLSSDQAGRVAESVAAAPGMHAKERLIATPYEPVIHDPENIKARAKQYGAHDPMYRRKEPRADQAWKDSPEVKAIIDGIAQATVQASKWAAAVEAGKLSPEARPFIRRRLQRLAATLAKIIERM